MCNFSSLGRFRGCESRMRSQSGSQKWFARSLDVSGSLYSPLRTVTLRLSLRSVDLVVGENATASRFVTVRDPERQLDQEDLEPGRSFNRHCSIDGGEDDLVSVTCLGQAHIRCL